MLQKLKLRLFGIKSKGENHLFPPNTNFKTTMPVEGITFEQWFKGDWIKIIGMQN